MASFASAPLSCVVRSEGTLGLFFSSWLIVDDEASSQRGGTWTLNPMADLSIDVQPGCAAARGCRQHGDQGCGDQPCPLTVRSEQDSRDAESLDAHVHDHPSRSL